MKATKLAMSAAAAVLLAREAPAQVIPASAQVGAPTSLLPGIAKWGKPGATPEPREILVPVKPATAVPAPVASVTLSPAAEDRIRAIRYLSSADSPSSPAVEDALIVSLRSDRNEMVRSEAAAALANGRGSSNRIIVALSHSIASSDRDGYPIEPSARVRAVAAHALDRSMTRARASEASNVVQTNDEKKSFKLGDSEYPKQYYSAVARLPQALINDFGKQALQIGAKIGYTDKNAMAPVPEIQTVAAKPKTIVELVTGKTTPRLTPVTIVPTNARPISTMVRSAPVVSTPSVTGIPQPQPVATLSAVPVVTLPSAANAISKTSPQPLLMPTMPMPSPKTTAQLAAGVPVSNVSKTVTMAVPTIVVPTVAAGVVEAPKLVVPMPTPVPVQASRIAIPVPVTIPVVAPPTLKEARLIPNFAPIEKVSNPVPVVKLPVEKVSNEVPVERISIPSFAEPTGQPNWVPSSRKIPAEPTSIPTAAR